MALCKLVPELSLRLYLQGALTADQIASETIAYEFLTQVSNETQSCTLYTDLHK